MPIRLIFNIQNMFGIVVQRFLIDNFAFSDEVMLWVLIGQQWTPSMGTYAGPSPHSLYIYLENGISVEVHWNNSSVV